MIGEAEFWKRWEGPGTVYVVTAKKDSVSSWKNAGRPHFLIAQNESTVILSNREAQP